MVEIIVVAFIFSIIVAALFTVFRGTLDSWRKAETLMDLYQNARIALDSMARELPEAVLYQDSPNTAYWTKFEGKASGSGIKVNSTGDEIFFVAPVQGNPGKQDICEIGYWLRNDNALMKHFEYFDGTTIPVVYDFASGGADSILAKNVKTLQFTYYYRHSLGAVPATDSPALHSWDSGADNPGGRPENYDAGGNVKKPDGLPDAVAVSITVMNRNDTQEKTFTDYIVIRGAK